LSEGVAIAQRLLSRGGEKKIVGHSRAPIDRCKRRITTYQTGFRYTFTNGLNAKQLTAMHKKGVLKQKAQQDTPANFATCANRAMVQLAAMNIRCSSSSHFCAAGGAKLGLWRLPDPSRDAQKISRRSTIRTPPALPRLWKTCANS
jgi:hypothetical protein